MKNLCRDAWVSVIMPAGKRHGQRSVNAAKNREGFITPMKPILDPNIVGPHPELADLSRTVVLLIDLQNHSCSPKGHFARNAIHTSAKGFESNRSTMPTGGTA